MGKRGLMFLFVLVLFAGAVSALNTCYDSDGGLNYPVYGYVYGINSSGTNYTYYDSCVSNNLIERYCNGTIANFVSVSCPGLFGSGYICSGGKCVSSGNQTGNFLLQIFDIYNQTTGSGSVTNDRVKFRDINSGETYYTVFTTTEGSGTVTIGGSTYAVTFQGSGEEGRVSVSFQNPRGDPLYIYLNGYTILGIPNPPTDYLLLQIFDIYNQTTGSGSVTNDRVKFRDINSGETYYTVFTTTEGSGTVTIGGSTYAVTFQGSGEEGRVRVNVGIPYGTPLYTYLYGHLLFPVVQSPPQNCTDSDGGINYYVKGTVLVGAQRFIDVCSTNSKLIEYYCSGSSFAALNYTCPSGCVNGACKKKTSNCGLLSRLFGKSCNAANVNNPTGMVVDDSGEISCGLIMRIFGKC